MIGEINMWGDHVVGKSIHKQKHSEEIASLDRGIVHIEEDYYLFPNCKVYKKTPNGKFIEKKQIPQGQKYTFLY